MTESERIGGIRWHTDSRKCSHSNNDVCATCDFDGYYERTYPACPWRDPELDREASDDLL